MSGSRTWLWIDLPSFGSTADKMFTLPVFCSVGPPEALDPLELLFAEHAAAITITTASGINSLGRRMDRPPWVSCFHSYTHSVRGQLRSSGPVGGSREARAVMWSPHLLSSIA